MAREGTDVANLQSVAPSETELLRRGKKVFGIRWWVKLGIVPERIEPGHPEQNGRHERMHRTLKAAVASPPRSDWEVQHDALEAFRDEFNHVRPHEALDMETPTSRYTRSQRQFPNSLPDPDYPDHFDIRRIRKTASAIDVDCISGSVHAGLLPTPWT